MIFSKNSKINEEREQKKKWILAQINLIIQGKGYKLSNLEIYPEHFGNVIVELSNDKLTLRFFQDRDDIYMDKKLSGSIHWSDQQLIVSHSENTGDGYNTLIKAIEQIIK